MLQRLPRDDDFRDDDFRDDDFRDELRFRELERFPLERRLGTLPPALRASDSPIAIACLRLLTRLPERPLLSLPRFISCIARLTLLCAFLPYLAMLRSPVTALAARGTHSIHGPQS
jgi:hypothetical protein